MTEESSAKFVNINDVSFCATHLKEVCEQCDVDFREDNDAFFGYDPIDRDGMECPAAHLNEDDFYICEEHSDASCVQCFAWKKRIARLRTAAKKAGKKY